MFNRREQQALLGLAAALLVGSLLAVGDWFHPAALSDFRVIPRAVEPPPPLSFAPKMQVPVLLNSSTAVELADLPSIGHKMAGAIVNFRRQHGPFERFE